MIALLCSLAVLTVLIVWVGTILHRFQATAFLRFNGLESCGCFADYDIIEEKRKIIKETQKQLLLNRLILNAAVSKPGIGKLTIIKDQNDPVDWLSRNLQVTFHVNSEVMKVSLLGTNRKETAMLVNAVVDAYMTEIVDAERKKRDERISELKKLQAEKTREVKSAHGDLDAVKDLQKDLDSITAELEKLHVESFCALRITVLQKAEVPE